VQSLVLLLRRQFAICTLIKNILIYAEHLLKNTSTDGKNEYIRTIALYLIHSSSSDLKASLVAKEEAGVSQRASAQTDMLF